MFLHNFVTRAFWSMSNSVIVSAIRPKYIAQGNSKREECVTDFSKFVAPNDQDFSIAIDYNLCNTERIRTVPISFLSFSCPSLIPFQLAPNGITYANTVIVQFHDKFITQGDKGKGGGGGS